MVELTRTVRFCINTGGDWPAHEAGLPPRHNTYSAWPAMRGLGRYYELRVRCRGEVDPVTGYFVNIRHIDAAARQYAIPFLHGLRDSRDSPPMGLVMENLLQLMQHALDGSVVELRLCLTPCYSLSIRSDDMEAVLIRQQFEFSAAHRLHVPQLSDEENRRVFGKCNNPSGHGHNYRVEICLRSRMGMTGQVCDLEKIDELVDRVVIQKLDHKHLNLDVPQFRDDGGRLNPSVENIAKVIYDMLRDETKSIAAELKEVSVWETEKTVCTYGG